MSDLFARIGPKASSPDDFHLTSRTPVKYFPNKTWVREGYQVKKTRQQWNTNDYNADDSEHDSDTSSKGHDDGHDRDDKISWEPHVASIHRPQSPPSLLLRMGLSPGIKVEEVSQTVPKDVPADCVPSTPVSFKSAKPTPTMPAARTTLPTQPVQLSSGGTEGSEKELEKAGHKNTEIVPSSLSSVGSEQNQPNVITSLKTSSPHVIDLEKQGPGHSEQQEVARRSPPRVDGHHKNPRHATQALTTTNLPTPPSSTPLSDISSTSALPVAIPTNIPSQTDGEAREGCSSEVKSLLGRIVEQNTARRVADQRSSAQTQPIVIPPSVLTDEVCESVAKNMGQAQKEIDAILASPQIQSLIQAAAAGKQVSDASSFNPNTQSSISSPSRIPVQIPPEMLTSQGPANEYTSGHSRNNHSDRASPALSRDRGSSAEYNDDRYYHSRHEPYSPRGRGRGRGLFRARGRGRGRGRGFAPYDVSPPDAQHPHIPNILTLNMFMTINTAEAGAEVGVQERAKAGTAAEAEAEAEAGALVIHDHGPLRPALNYIAQDMIMIQFLRVVVEHLITLARTNIPRDIPVPDHGHR
ncbi:hypothetical protein BJ165DRAFT_1533388 [Panaeolus papilionaceus]|nr:hypothetical protein BJ165DRAFT_1533388 [Panaeolus papilionaceus]